MKSLVRILHYFKRNLNRFMLGLLFSFMASIFNGLTLMSLKPIFDILGSGNIESYQIPFSTTEYQAALDSPLEKNIKEQVLRLSGEKQQQRIERAAKQQQEIGKLLFVKIRRKIIEWKLKLNHAIADIPPLTLLLYVSLGILPIYFFKMVSNLFTVYLINTSGLRAIRDIRNDLTEKLMRFPMNQFVQQKTGVIMSRIINDVNIISNSISEELRVSINNFFVLVTHLIFLAIIDAKLLALVLIGVPLILWPISALSKRIRSTTTDEQSLLATLHGHLQEVISGIRVIRAFGMEDGEMKKFEADNQYLYKKTYLNKVFGTLGPSIVEVMNSFIVAALIAYGGYQIYHGHMSPGTFFTFLFTLLIVLSPMKQMANWVNIINRAISAGDRVFEILDMETEDVTVGNKTFDTLKEGIQFKRVSFVYPESTEKVLRNISFDVKVGQTIALVGHSGAGKSTLVDLIPRFYQPTSGQILFDGTDSREFKSQELRKKMAIVTQEIILFSGTIRENICYNQENISKEQVVAAAKKAFAHEFIMKLPNGYDTDIGTRGLLLSGGQRQRISIARALLKNPEVLILDEATSALDTKSERLVQQALESLMKNRTTFVIAHRLSTIYHADLILVMDKGRIVEKGTHEQLLKNSGAYNELYKMQFQKKATKNGNANSKSKTLKNSEEDTAKKPVRKRKT